VSGKVSIEEGEGYVSADYVTLSTEFVQAESKEEEAARLAKEEAERKAAEEAAKKAAEKSSKSSSSILQLHLVVHLHTMHHPDLMEQQLQTSQASSLVIHM